MNNNMKYFALIAIGYVFIVFTANLSAEEDINPDNNKDSQETKSSEDDSAMDKCMKDAKTKKDKKKCAKDNEQTIEEFIDDEGLEIIEGYLEIYTDEDKENYFLKLNQEDLNKKFLYFSYIMNAPQGSTLTGGRPSDGKVLEFRKFKKDNIRKI